MPVITIRGQLGSGTREIGQLIAKRLNIDYVDRQIIAEIAKRLNTPNHSIAEKEMPPSSFLDRIAEALGSTYSFDSIYPTMDLGALASMPNDTEYLAGLTTVITDLAKVRSVVIRGRGSQFILKDFPGVFHVMIVAPLEMRVKRTMEDRNLKDEKSAREEIARFEKGRYEFSKRYFHADMKDPIHYDLVVNTGRLDYEAAASIVVNAVSLMTKPAAP